MRDQVTVIIPTYNRAHLLKEAIDSVLKQTYTNFELLVVDDHSTDDTEEIVKSYKDSRTKYLVNKRSKGAQGARNTGIFAAKGEWLAFLDSDDVWTKEKLEKQLATITNRQDLVGVSCGFKRVNFDSNTTEATVSPNKKEFTFNDLIYKNFLGGFSVFLCRKTTALKIDGVDESFRALQDRDFYTRLLNFGKIYAIKEPLVQYRITDKDRISSNDQSKLEALEMYYEKFRDEIKQHAICEAYIHHRLYLLHKKLYGKKKYQPSFKELYLLFKHEPKAFLKVIINKLQ